MRSGRFALDDHSRLAYTEILPDKTKDTAVAFLARAHAWYAAAVITIERVLSDNGSCHRSKTWAATCSDLGIIPKRTRPYRLQTNGKAERFHRTLADEWAYAPPTPPKPNALPPLTPGCTPTTTTGVTPHSQASRPSATSPTSLDRTASRPSRSPRVMYSSSASARSLSRTALSRRIVVSLIQ